MEQMAGESNPQKDEFLPSSYIDLKQGIAINNDSGNWLNEVVIKPIEVTSN